MSLVLVSAPSVYPVSLAEAKAHLRIDSSDEDALIEGLISAATQNIDGETGWLGRALVTQTWNLYLDSFPCRPHECDFAKKYGIRVPLPPLQSVESIVYVDVSGTETTLVADQYQIKKGENGVILPAFGTSWPQTRSVSDAVRVKFVAGYEPTAASPTDFADSVPQPIKQAILLTVGHWFENRVPVVVGASFADLPMSAQYLLNPLRVWA